MNIPKELHQKLAESKIIAVLVIEDAVDAVPAARALIKGGVNAIELALRTPLSIEAIKHIRVEVPEMILGVGTVLTQDQVDEIQAIGVDFAVSPGINATVAGHALEAGLPFAPGIMTPSDIELALDLGCTTLKYFPAESAGGIKHLLGMAGPYLHRNIDFIPLGGVSPDNLKDYLGISQVTAVGGSWIATKDKISAKDWRGITDAAKSAMDIASKLR